jgi:hypothetical protein
MLDGDTTFVISVLFKVSGFSDKESFCFSRLASSRIMCLLSFIQKLPINNYIFLFIYKQALNINFICNINNNITTKSIFFGF